MSNELTVQGVKYARFIDIPKDCLPKWGTPEWISLRRELSKARLRKLLALSQPERQVS